MAQSTVVPSKLSLQAPGRMMDDDVVVNCAWRGIHQFQLELLQGHDDDGCAAVGCGWRGIHQLQLGLGDIREAGGPHEERARGQQQGDHHL